MSRRRPREIIYPLRGIDPHSTFADPAGAPGLACPLRVSDPRDGGVLGNARSLTA